MFGSALAESAQRQIDVHDAAIARHMTAFETQTVGQRQHAGVLFQNVAIKLVKALEACPADQLFHQVATQALMCQMPAHDDGELATIGGLVDCHTSDSTDQGSADWQRFGGNQSDFALAVGGAELQRLLGCQFTHRVQEAQANFLWREQRETLSQRFGVFRLDWPHQQLAAVIEHQPLAPGLWQTLAFHRQRPQARDGSEGDGHGSKHSGWMIAAPGWEHALIGYAAIHRGEKRMTEKELRELTQAWPGVQSDVKWQDDLVFTVADKMFCCICLRGTETNKLSFKVEDERFLELTDREGFRPAPYLARARWVTVDKPSAQDAQELRALLRRAYELVRSKLSKRLQRELAD